MTKYTPAWLRCSIEEIRGALELRVVGAGLALVHFITYLQWFGTRQYRFMSDANISPICWPIFRSCEAWKVFDPDQMQIIGLIYGLVAIATAALFISRRFTGLAWSLLLLLSIVKICLYMQDYRLLRNFHAIPFVVSAVFLFLPDKSRLVRYFIVAIYFFAGVLKLNRDWISGQAFLREGLQGGQIFEFLSASGLLPISTVYVVVLETILIFGLVARLRWLGWASFIQLVIFHIVSIEIVGPTFPAIMICLLSIFPAVYFLERKNDRHVSDHQGEEKLRPLLLGLNISGVIVLVTYAFLQIYPKAKSGDEALLYEWRIVSLNMLAATVICKGSIQSVYSNRTVDMTHEVSKVTRLQAFRCDPYVYYDRAKAICKSLQGQPGFQRVQMKLASRRSTETQFTDIVDVEDMCRNEISYTIVWPNSWIQR